MKSSMENRAAADAVSLAEQGTPSGDEFRIAPHPQVDQDDEQGENGFLVVRHRSQFFVLDLHGLLHFAGVVRVLRLAVRATQSNKEKPR